MILLIVAICFSAFYALLQLYYIHHWDKTPSFSVTPDFIPSLPLSVIVVGRNEEASIDKCLRSILQQNFPAELFEVTFIDDRSTDQTLSVARGIAHPSLKAIRLADHPEFIYEPAFKKSGIELGVHLAKYDAIVVTDADCVCPPDWLRTLSWIFETNKPVFIAGPVNIISTGSMLTRLQWLENIVIMIITAAGIRSRLHDIANGANMAFLKRPFLDVKPYRDNYHFASGDDMFLIEKMRNKYPDKIVFAKSAHATVSTEALDDWKSFIRQRLRRAGKNKGLQNNLISNIWLFAGAYHCMLIICFISALFYPAAWIAFTVLLIVKWASDAFIMLKGISFFGERLNALEFIRLQGLYTYYVMTMGINMLAGKKGDW